jgi:hypothetical protein
MIDLASEAIAVCFWKPYITTKDARGSLGAPHDQTPFIYLFFSTTTSPHTFPRRAASKK